MIEAYPLCWPIGQKRTANPTYSRFGDHTLTQSCKRLLEEIDRMRGTNAIISSNIPIKQDGTPHANYLKCNIPNKGVAVYFTRNKQQVVLACDRWYNVEDNIWAIACSIEAMRSLERWGVSEMLDRAFSGFLAIPAAGEAHSKSCWDVLGIPITKDKKEIQRAWRGKAKIADILSGAGNDELVEVNAAYTQALKYAEQ